MSLADAKRITIGDKRAVMLSIDDGVVWRGLPNGYVELEYIETTGTQYIDTGFKPNQDTRVVCEFMWRGTSSTRDIYGARQALNTNTYWLRVISSQWQPAYDTALGSTGIATDTTKWHIADQNKNIFSIDGVVGKEFEYATFQSPVSLAFGGGYATYQGGTFYPGKARYRSFKIYDNGVLVRRFIPCKDADGNIGMYDTVNDQFYGNAGTDEFIAGDAWNGLPEGYKQLDYIETTGTQYIDTGFKPNQDTRVCCEFMLTAIVNLTCVYGGRAGVANKDFSFRTSRSGGVDRWQPIYGSQYGTFTDIPVDTMVWHEIDHNKNEFYFDGELKTQTPLTYAEFAATRNLTISAGATSSNKYCSDARFRWFKVYDNGDLIRDYVPCEDPNGVIGMYDRVEAKFYRNAGTGDFLYA